MCRRGVGIPEQSLWREIVASPFLAVVYFLFAMLIVVPILLWARWNDEI